MSSFLKTAKRHSEHFVGSMLKLEDLAECIMLSDVNGLMVEMEEPVGEIQFGTFDVPLTISFLNGTPFLRARYTHRNQTVMVYGAGDVESNSLFSVTLTPPPKMKHPAVALAGPTAVDKKLSAVPHAYELAKMKHKTGLSVYRINKSAQAPAPTLLRDEACDLQIIKANQSIPYLDIRVEKGCCSTFLHWIGLTFTDAYFACYKGDAFIGTISPKISCGFTRYAYVIDFDNNNVPSPTHVPKAIVLATAIVMLMNLGPINISEKIMEEA